MSGNPLDFSHKTMSTGPLEPVILENEHIAVHVLPYGLTIHRIVVKTQDILVGPEDPQAVKSDGRQFRNTVLGRYANRLHSQAANAAVPGLKLSGDITLHSGEDGFDQRVWEHLPPERVRIVHAMPQPPGETWRFFGFDSPAGDQGFPGMLRIEARIALRERAGTLGEVEISYAVLHGRTETEATPLNLTQHLGFNLSPFDGKSKDDVLDHVLQLSASHYVDIDARGLPTGKLNSVTGTALDFQQARPIGKELLGAGFDHNLVFSPSLKPTAIKHAGTIDLGQIDDYSTVAGTLSHPQSPINLTFRTTSRAVQLYTANHFDPSSPTSRKDLHRLGGQKAGYGQHGALFLEFQAPNSTFLHPELIKANGGNDTIVRPGDLVEQYLKIEIRA